eukprot:scaffold243098_cov14-Tisochrysis_lutea.AAC.1
MANETDIKAQIKLRFLTSSKQPVVVVRSFQLIEKKTTRQFKTLDSTLQTVDPVTGVKQAVTYRCLDIDKMVPSLMGVSKVGKEQVRLSASSTLCMRCHPRACVQAVLDNVIFVHQEESNWPLAEGKVLKDKFDDIFSATKYTKALETLRKMRLEKTQEVRSLPGIPFVRDIFWKRSKVRSACSLTEVGRSCTDKAGSAVQGGCWFLFVPGGR